MERNKKGSGLGGGDCSGVIREGVVDDRRRQWESVDVVGGDDPKIWSSTIESLWSVALAPSSPLRSSDRETHPEEVRSRRARDVGKKSSVCQDDIISINSVKGHSPHA